MKILQIKTKGKNSKFNYLISITTILVFSSVFINFPEHLMGDTATIKNLVVTLAYSFGWVGIILVSITNNNDRFLLFSRYFWLLTLISALISIYVNVTSIEAMWALLPVVIFLTPWYGLRYFISSFIGLSSITALFSLFVIVTLIIRVRSNKCA